MSKQRFILIGWWMFGMATIVLFVAAMKQKEQKLCTAINIEIAGLHNYIFVDQNEIKQILKTNGALVGKETSQIDLNNTEEVLKKDPWIKQADLFFDNSDMLHVKINERDPLARIFTLAGNSFYIDSSGLRLPLNENQTARVPVFTSFTSNKNILSVPDSALLNDIKKIAQVVSSDSFWIEQVSQINITSQHTFQIVPVLGNQIIELGNADSLQSKFGRLYSFYKQVWAKAGFEKYENIDVQYYGEVVATVRGVARSSVDSTESVYIYNNNLPNINAATNLSIAKDSVIKSPIPRKIVGLKQKIPVKPKPWNKAKPKAIIITRG